MTDTLHYPLPASLVEPTKDIHKEVGSNKKLLNTQFCHATCGRYQTFYANSAARIKDTQWNVIIGAARRFAKTIRKPVDPMVIVLSMLRQTSLNLTVIKVIYYLVMYSPLCFDS